VPPDDDPTFFTTSNEPFFPGTVALLNSLRLTGNLSPLVVLDVGLLPSQRARLEEHATIVEVPGVTRSQFKAFPRFFDPAGVIAIIDSDMIVTDSLSPIMKAASMGRICVYPDPASDRWFPEWETVLELRAPPRRQTYVNSGFVALSTRHWPEFLSRLWELSERVPSRAVFSGSVMNNPFWMADQDHFNALLMSEIPPEALEILPATQQAHPGDLELTTVIEAKTLQCELRGERPSILHHSMTPKAWSRRGWRRVRRDAYVRLFGRVVCGDDVSLRLEPMEVPLWLRPNWSGRAALTGLGMGHGIVAEIRRRWRGRRTTV
jgi:hypothetical protein